MFVILLKKAANSGSPYYLHSRVESNASTQSTPRRLWKAVTYITASCTELYPLPYLAVHQQILYSQMTYQWVGRAWCRTDRLVPHQVKLIFDWQRTAGGRFGSCYLDWIDLPVSLYCHSKVKWTWWGMSLSVLHQAHHYNKTPWADTYQCDRHSGQGEREGMHWERHVQCENSFLHWKINLPVCEVLSGQSFQTIE